MSEDRHKLSKQEKREAAAINTAQQSGKTVTYIDTDGCEVSVTPSGHVFYNAGDWW